MQPDPLLPNHHRPDVGVGGVLDEMIDRIAAENLDALALHDFRNRRAELHGRLSLAQAGLIPTDLPQLEQDFAGR